MVITITNADTRLLQMIDLLNIDSKKPYKIKHDESSMQKALKELENKEYKICKNFEEYKKEVSN